MKSSKFAALPLLALLLLWASPAYGQSDRGNITGTVTDPTGAVVAGAKVTARNLNSGEVRETTTSDEGNYTLPELRADPYSVTVEAPGFKTSTFERVQVAVQVTRSLDVQLEIGAVADVVTITSEQTPVIQTDSPARQTNVTERQVKELPLLVSAESAGRTPLAFIFLDSNVTPAAGEGTNASNFRVSGGQGLGTEILIDGAATRRAQRGTFFSEVAPGPNAFQEFTISTSSFSAEFGSTSGGVVNFTFKSGGNEFHGEAYELHRNRVLNANSFSRNASGFRRDIDTQHDFGFNIGGPVYLPRFGEGGPSLLSLKNRTFFFFNYEGYRFNQSETVNLNVPTERMRLGDFSELLTDPNVLSQFGPGGVQLFSPIAGFDAQGRPISAAPNTRAAIPGNRIDLFRLPTGQSIIDPAGFAILQNFPRPQRPGVFKNYTASTSRPIEMNNVVMKFDQVITESQRLALSYSYRKSSNIQGGFPRFERPLVAFGRWDQNFKSHFIRAQHDWSFTPTLLNHFNAGYTRYDVTNANTTLGFDTFSLGLPRGSFIGGAFPSIDFPNYGDPATGDLNRNSLRAYQGIGSTFFNDLPFADNTVQLSDFMTYIRGRHTLKFGADARIQQFNVAQLQSPGGWFNFMHHQTSQNSGDNQGWPIASMLVGATEWSFNSSKTIDPGWRYFYPAFFVQDDIKATQKLTLNVGLRYEVPGPRTESKGRLRGFDPDVPNPAAGGRRGALVAANGTGALQAEHEGLAPRDYSAIGPRLGFAYALNDRTVVRGGYGIYYSPIQYGTGADNAITEGTQGYNTHVAYPNNGPDANFFLRNFPALPSVDPTNQFIDSGDISYFDQNYKAGRNQNWSLDIQRELPYNFAVSAGYIGSKGTRLRSNFAPINAIPLNALRLGNEFLRKPLSALNSNERAFAAQVGVALPANNAAVFPGFTGTVAESLRPFPQYRNIINILEHEGQSWYHAGQFKLDRRFSQGIQFGLSYTFSKLITNASEDLLGVGPLGGVVQNPYDRNSLRSVSPNSIPHVLVFNYLLELPFGKGRRFLDQGGVVNTILGGWQVGAIHRYQSGAPLVVSSNRAVGFLSPDVFNVGGNLRPNLTGQPILTNNPQEGLGFRIINQAAFSDPRNFDAGPPLLLQNGTVNPDYVTYYANPLLFFGNSPAVFPNIRPFPFYSENVSLLKKTRLTETFTLELRGEFFNLFNRHRYAGPDTNFASGGFGISGIDNGYGPRVIQVGARVIF